MRSLLAALLLAIAFTPSHIAAAQTAKAATRKPAARSSATVPTKSAVAAATPAANTAPCNCSPATPPRTYTPYIAKQQSTRVQTLADGTTITTVTQTQIWRDAAGRTRTETTNTQSAGTVTRFVNVTDNSARVRYTWNLDAPSSARIVTVYRFPQPAQPAAAPAASPTPASARRYFPYKQESLPPQTIAGIYVEGYRTTRTIPAGYEGNNRDLTTVTEYWTAPDLGIQMRSTMDDPRNGKTTTEITDLQQTAPDPSLFELPQGYTVHETNPATP